MPPMDEMMRRIGQAKAFIDNGLCRVGPKLDKEDLAAALMTGGAGRSLGLADAVAHLTKQHSGAEALPILRQLADTAVGMRWLAADAGARAGRAAAWAAELENAAWGDLWPKARLAERAAAAGCGEIAERAEAWARGFVLGNRTAAPWSHVFALNQHEAIADEAAAAEAVSLQGHVLKALETYWPESFPGAEAMWAPY